MAIRAFSKNMLEEITEVIYIFLYFVLCLTWDINPDFMSNKPTHYLLEYDAFKKTTFKWILYNAMKKKIKDAIRRLKRVS